MADNVLAFVSVKGGVGKTTLAMETASSLANHFGKKVLLVDANYSAPNVDLYLDLTHDYTLHDALAGVGLHNAIYEKHGFDIIPASMYAKDNGDIYQLKKLLAKFKSRYDFIIIDSSPNYDEMKPVVAAADKIFVVTTPDRVSVETTAKAVKFARKSGTPIVGAIVNKVNNPQFENSIEDVEEYLEVPVLARIKHDDDVVEGVYYHKPMTIHKEKSDLSKEVKNFASALCGEPESPRGFFDYLLNFPRLSKLLGKEKVNRDVVRSSFY